MSELRTDYKGRSERAWLRLGLRDVYGAVELFDLVVDTASPMAIILRPDVFDRFLRWPGKEELSNFGPLPSGCKSSQVAAIVAKSHPDFAGLVGLPILRLGEYGGNASEFWFRYPVPE